MEVTISNEKSSGVVVDVSSFFLFEATADSDSLVADSRDSASLADDDAESCSWDSSDQCPSVDCDGDCSDDDRMFEQEEAERGRDDRAWDNNGGEIGRLRVDRHKSNVSVESTTKEFESLSEVEKNRLFWEACLAS